MNATKFSFNFVLCLTTFATVFDAIKISSNALQQVHLYSSESLSDNLFRARLLQSRMRNAGKAIQLRLIILNRNAARTHTRAERAHSASNLICTEPNAIEIINKKLSPACHCYNLVTYCTFSLSCAPPQVSALHSARDDRGEKVPSDPGTENNRIHFGRATRTRARRRQPAHRGQ